MPQHKTRRRAAVRCVARDTAFADLRMGRHEITTEPEDWHERFPSLHLYSHALAEHKLTLMRDRSCPASLFRRLMRELGMLLAIEATRNLPLIPKTVTGPDEITEGFVLLQKAIIVSILRAGLGLAEGALEIMPTAHIGHIGLQRLDDWTVQEHLIALPNPKDRFILMLDPVIGSGNTLCGAIQMLKQLASVEEQNIAIGSVLVSPIGVARVHERYPQVKIHAISMERELNKRNHIRPGFGDAADRLFGFAAGHENE